MSERLSWLGRGSLAAVVALALAGFVEHWRSVGAPPSLQPGYDHLVAPDSESTRQQLELAARIDPVVDVGVHLRAAAIARAAGEPAAAEAHYRRALALEPHNVVALLYLARAALVRGELDEAERRILRAVRVAPEDGEVHSLAGIVAASAGDLVAAEQHLRRAIATNNMTSRTTAETHNALAIVLARRGALAAAVAEARAAVAADPSFAEAAANLHRLQTATRRQPDE